MSVARDPFIRGLPARAVLRDGSVVDVRAIRADDKERLRAAFARLSPRTVYQRFFHFVTGLTDDDLRRWTELDFQDHVAIVLTVGDESDERIVAVGRYIRVASGADTAEVGFTVADDYQRRGAGSLLLRHLVAIARGRGIRNLAAVVLPDNLAMRELFRRSNLPLRETIDGGIRRMVLDVAPVSSASRVRKAIQWAAQVALTAVLGLASLTAHGAAAVPPYHEPPRVVSYRDAVSRAAPSVVTVHSAHVARSPLLLAPKVMEQGLGSGVIVDGDGYIVTNFHVIEEASQLAVAHPNGTIYGAQLVGADPVSDLALLKIDGDNLTAIAFADINDVAVGDVVLAVGNPFGIGQTVTQGIVSAIVRRGTDPVDNFVQTDAAINPGNSGGALIDTAGRLIGINTVILSKSGGSEGIGFAIPGDLVQRVVTVLKAKRRVARSWLGATTTTSARGDGAVVVAVDPGGPADRAAIAAGDVIVRVDGKAVRHAQDVNGIVIGNEPGTRVPMEIVRGGKHANVDVQLARNPGGERK